jgi:small-conductance mechanosensitive channel
MQNETTAAPDDNISGLSGFSDSIQSGWFDAVAWVSSHSLRILISSVIAVAIVFALLGLKSLGMRLCRRGVAGDVTAIVGRALASTKLWFMLAVAAQLVARYSSAPEIVAEVTRFIFTVAVVLQGAIWARAVILGVIEHRAGGVDNGNLGSAMGIIRLLVSVALFIIAAILILDNLGVNVTGLVAGLGIGGIAIGLAAQGIFSDLFAALSILFDKPFRKGDGIRWDTTSGSVESIGLKSTRIRSLSGEQIIVSNANLLNKELHNFNRLDRRRMVHKIGVVYQTRPEVLARIPEIVREIVEAHEKCHLLRCGMTGFGASSLDFELQFDVQSTDYEEVFATNHAVLIAILERFNAEGIEFAYPTQTTFTAAPDGTMIMPYADVKMMATEADGNIRTAE